MDLVLLLIEIVSKSYERINTQHSDSILLIISELTEYWYQLTQHKRLLHLICKKPKTSSSCSSHHWGFFSTEVYELLAELLLLTSRFRITVVEEGTRRDS